MGVHVYVGMRARSCEAPLACLLIVYVYIRFDRMYVSCVCLCMCVYRHARSSSLSKLSVSTNTSITGVWKTMRIFFLFLAYKVSITIVSLNV